MGSPCSNPTSLWVHPSAPPEWKHNKPESLSKKRSDYWSFSTCFSIRDKLVCGTKDWSTFIMIWGSRMVCVRSVWRSCFGSIRMIKCVWVWAVGFYYLREVSSVMIPQCHSKPADSTLSITVSFEGKTQTSQQTEEEEWNRWQQTYMIFFYWTAQSKVTIVWTKIKKKPLYV